MRERGQNVFDKIMAENFLNLRRETDIQVQETQRVPNNMKPSRPTLKHIITKVAKVKGIILKAAREKQRVTCKGTPIRYQLIFMQKLCRTEGSGMIY